MSGRHVVLCILGFGAVAGIAADGTRLFQPPRTAVVSIAAVFDGYHKKDVLEAQLREKQTALDAQIKALEKRYKEVGEEIPFTEPGAGLRAKKLEQMELKLKADELKQRELDKLEKIWMNSLAELQEEITSEIRSYATAQDLDIVLEGVGEQESGIQVADRPLRQAGDRHHSGDH